METVYCENLAELRREKDYLERKLKIKIKIKGKDVIIKGDPLDEYEASLVIDAINLGFPAQVASLLQNEDFIFEKINIKDHTRRKNLELIRGRLIGTHGKTKNTIEQISGCTIKIKGNIVGIIGPAETAEYITTAITNIIKGTKQTNVYKYLERINAKKREQRD